MFSSLSELDRENLIAPCLCWTDVLTDERAIELGASILDTFDKWKLRQADPQGFVTVGAGGGLLNYLNGEKLVPVDELEPHQCAGLYVQNDIDLAFKLWFDNDPDFAKLIEFSQGIQTALSIVGLWAVGVASAGSLCRLNGFLVRSMRHELIQYGTDLVSRREADDVELRKKHQQMNTLRNQRRVKLAEKKKEKEAELRRLAFNYWQLKPKESKDDVIWYLQKYAEQKYKTSTMRRLLVGVRDKALAALAR